MSPEQLVTTLFHDPAAAAGMFPAEPDLDFILAQYRDLTALARFSWTPFLSNPKLERRLHPSSAPSASRRTESGGRHQGGERGRAQLGPAGDDEAGLSRTVGDTRALGLALTGLGLTGSLGRRPGPGRVDALLTEALELWRALDWPVGQHMALVNLGMTAYLAGDLAQAEAYQRAWLAIAEQIQVPYRLGTSSMFVAQLELRRGNTQTAARLLRQALRQ
jgi:hypothetical protein